MGGCLDDVSVMSRSCLFWLGRCAGNCVVMSLSCLGHVSVVSRSRLGDVSVLVWCGLSDVSSSARGCRDDVTVLYPQCVRDDTAMFG